MKGEGKGRTEEWIRERLQKDKEEGVYRTLPDPLPLGTVDLRSNDHLGLFEDPTLRERIQQALREEPLSGSTGSRLISGNSKLHLDLEEEMAAHYRAGTGLLFSTGYQANVGLLSALGERGNSLIYDEKVHASMRDGIRSALARAHSFRHNDPIDLEKKLQRAQGPTFILIEGLYSMDGDRAPLHPILELAERHQASIVLDEAHSNGVLGEKGRGEAARQGVEERIFARVMPFGKAVCQQGAFVTGPQLLKELLIGHARSFIFSTAPSFPALVALRESFRYAMEADARREALFEKVERFRYRAQQEGIALFEDADGPIQGVQVPGAEAAKRLEELLWEKGFAVKAVRKPTVPEGKERIRIVIHADTSNEAIDELVRILKQAL